jgi:hypothetical protein
MANLSAWVLLARTLIPSYRRKPVKLNEKNQPNIVICPSAGAVQESGTGTKLLMSVAEFSPNQPTAKSVGSFPGSRKPIL